MAVTFDLRRLARRTDVGASRGFRCLLAVFPGKQTATFKSVFACRRDGLREREEIAMPATMGMATMGARVQAAAPRARKGHPLLRAWRSRFSQPWKALS